jgi:tetratricopeptide (TPR) repeat protein
LFFQSYYDYSCAQSSISNKALDDFVIETIDEFNVIAPEINNRHLMSFKNSVSFSPGVQLLINSNNQEIFIKATVGELVKFYAYYEAVNYLYETDKINLIEFIYKDNFAEILQKNIDNLENLITNKIITLYSNTEEELKSAVNTLFDAISNIEISEAKFLMTPLIKKINEKIINKSQDDYFDFDTENIINYIQTQSNEVINSQFYEKGNRAWWTAIVAVLGVGFVIASLGSFAMMLGALVTWYYTPNLKTAKFCAKNAVRIYDLWPFIKKPNRSYMFYNNILANAAFVEGDYNECIKWCDEWISNADGPSNDNNDDRDMEQSSNESEAKVLKARALGKLKRYAEATALLTSTLPFYTLLGQKYIPLMYLGKIFKDQGNTFLAKTNLKFAAEHKPLFGSAVNQFIAFYEYADLLDQMGDGEKALEFYKKADKACKVPWSPPSNKSLAKEYRAMIDESWVLMVSKFENIPTVKNKYNEGMPAPQTVKLKIYGMTFDNKIIELKKENIKISFNYPTFLKLKSIEKNDEYLIATIEYNETINSAKIDFYAIIKWMTGGGSSSTKTRNASLTVKKIILNDIYLFYAQSGNSKSNNIVEKNEIVNQNRKVYILGRAFPEETIENPENRNVIVTIKGTKKEKSVILSYFDRKNNTLWFKSKDFSFCDLIDTPDDAEKIEISTGDYLSDTGNLNDSKAFINSMEKYFSPKRVIVRGSANSSATTDDIEFLDLNFLQNPGFEVFEIKDVKASRKIHVNNNPDILYLSGHGFHDIAGFQYNSQDTFSPNDLIKDKHWHDIDILIFSACSILDINDYHGNYTDPNSHNFSPGKKWAKTGPKYFLGYCHYSPTDIYSANIISEWCRLYEKRGDAIEAWGSQNVTNQSVGMSACAIDASKPVGQRVYWYYVDHYIDDRIWFEVQEKEWDKMHVYSLNEEFSYED